MANANGNGDAGVPSRPARRAPGPARRSRATPGRPARSRRRPAAEGANPTIHQRELGFRLRELRNALGLTVEEVGIRLECSAAKISRLETGARRAVLRDVRDLARIYGVTDQAQVDELLDLARRAREPGWWTEYEEPVFSPYLGLEQEAVAITAFSMFHVPALLQTGDYARSTIRSIERKIDPVALGQRVEARLRRQTLFDRQSPPRYRVLLDEVVLRREMGGPSVMRTQLEKLLLSISEEKAAVQIIPFGVGGHASTDSNFVVLELPEVTQQPVVVYVESLFTNRYLERPAEVARYREAVEYLRDAALNPRDSADLIAEIRSQYKA